MESLNDELPVKLTMALCSGTNEVANVRVACKGCVSDAENISRKLSELGLPLVRPGGRLLQASCSSRVTEDDLVATVFSAVRSQGRSFRSYEVTGHALDHPITFPQGAYLKALTGIVDG